jgi:hypothetical protein
MRNPLKMVLSAVCQGQCMRIEGRLLSEQGRDITAGICGRQEAGGLRLGGKPIGFSTPEGSKIPQIQGRRSLLCLRTTNLNETTRYLEQRRTLCE